MRGSKIYVRIVHLSHRERPVRASLAISWVGVSSHPRMMTFENLEFTVPFRGSVDEEEIKNTLDL